MAINTATVITRVDDLDGTTGDSVTTRRFTLDVEMELTDGNAEVVRKLLADTFAKARPAAAKGTPRKATVAETRAYNKRVREWAKKVGEPIAKSGTPSKKAIAAYVAATGDSR